jgi:hypothetical protein
MKSPAVEPLRAFLFFAPYPAGGRCSQQLKKPAFVTRQSASVEALFTSGYIDGQLQHDEPACFLYHRKGELLFRRLIGRLGAAARTALEQAAVRVGKLDMNFNILPIRLYSYFNALTGIRVAARRAG